MIAYLDCRIAEAERIITRHPDRRKVTRLALAGVRWLPRDLDMAKPGWHICGVHDPTFFPSETVPYVPASMDLLPGDTFRARLIAALSTGRLEVYVDGWVRKVHNTQDDDNLPICAIEFQPSPLAPTKHFLHAVPHLLHTDLDSMPDRYLAPSGKPRFRMRKAINVPLAPKVSVSAVDVRDR